MQHTPKRLTARITGIQQNVMTGKTPEGETVIMMKPVNGSPKFGDTFSFVPEIPSNPTWKQYTWFGYAPKLSQAAVVLPSPEEWPTEEQPDAPGTNKGLPSHHARHFDAAGNIILPPRPCDLEAKRQALRNAKHAAD
jgi:hypothetical protein